MNVRWTQFASDQLDELVDACNERRGLEAAVGLAKRIASRVRKLREFPRAAPPWRPAQDEAFRRLVVGDIVVLYRIVEDENLIYVLAVRHGRQRPPKPADVPKS